MAFRKYPNQVDLGGFFLLNPPEPHAKATYLEGLDVSDQITPAGGCAALPPAWYLNVPLDPDPGTPASALYGGEHILIGQVPTRTDLLGSGGQMAYYRSIKESNATGQQVIAWELFYGTISITAGPVGFPGGVERPAIYSRDHWILVAGERLIGDDIAADHLYLFYNPMEDDGAIVADWGTAAGEDSQKSNFACLGPNRFASHHPETLAFGNEYLTIDPYWP